MLTSRSDRRCSSPHSPTSSASRRSWDLQRSFSAIWSSKPVQYGLGMPLYTAEALILRTYKLAEADRIVVFLTRDRGKKRGVAPNARRSLKRFGAALEPLTEVRIAYFEKEQRELVGINYAEPIRSPLSASGQDALNYCHYFAELIDEWAADADVDERLYRLGTSALEALVAGVPVDALARYFECWLLRLQGVYPSDLALSTNATAFLAGAPRGWTLH